MGIGDTPEAAPGRKSGTITGITVRKSVLAFMTGRPMGMERLEDVEEGEGGKREENGREEKTKEGFTLSETKKRRMTELRTSLNGLSQNKWSQSGE